MGIWLAIRFIKIENKKDIKNIIKRITIILWVLEIGRIIFNFYSGNARNLNTYVPLYYCSILLYAGIFSGFFKGKLQRMGDVFISSVGIIAGVIFLIFPTTSLLIYPIYHFVTIQSFFYHGVMIYLGIIVNKYMYIELDKKDIIYYASLVIEISLIAFIINNIYGSNLMFISQDYPGTLITYLYKICGPWFTIVSILGQAIIPFYMMYWITKKLKYQKKM